MENTEQSTPDSAPQSVQEKLEAMFDDGEDSSNEPQDAAPSEEQSTEEPTDSAPDDSEDVDFEGVALRLPKEAATKLKSAVEGYKDYTQKTQQVAEARRMVEAQTALFNEQRAFQASISQELSAFQQIDAQLGEYRRLDWTQLTNDQSNTYRNNVEILKDRKEELTKALHQKKQTFDQSLSKHNPTLRGAQEKAVKLAIPDWKPETGKVLAEYASGLGYTDAELDNSYDPRLVQLLHKAQKWDSLQASKPAVANRANTASPVVRPGATVQQSKQIAMMNFRKSLKSAPDSASKSRLIQQRLESKF